MGNYVLMFDELGLEDIPLVGGKNASLGEIYNKLAKKGIPIPNGFATTAAAFNEFLKENKLDEKLKELLRTLDKKSYANLSEIGTEARRCIIAGDFSEKFTKTLLKAYEQISDDMLTEVAIRSSATAEDLPDASFAGLHDTFLNIKGNENVLKAVKNCFASLYTDRAIKYREDKGFKHEDVALSVGIQKMVRADKGCSGVIFTLDPESGFKDVVLISGVWGLGENMVQGVVIPDEFTVFKPTLLKGYDAIIQRKLGAKEKTMIYATSQDHAATMNIDTDRNKQLEFILTDDEIQRLAHWAVLIEEHYKKPMDIEWAKDGITNQLFILQARPETVHKTTEKNYAVAYDMPVKGKLLTQGNAVGNKIISGTIKLLSSPEEAYKLIPGDIIVTDSITPDWDPLLKKVNGIITNKGGRTSHAAIVARELDVPAVVGCFNATSALWNGLEVTLSCAEGNTGYIYEGIIPFKEHRIDFTKVKRTKTETKFILADPDRAFDLSFYPNDGVGLLRMEFIITHLIRIHPMALVAFNRLRDEAVKAYIEKLTSNYSKKEDYFTDKLSQGLATIAAAFYPKEVIVRLSDFKTNEYAKLIGGDIFEPTEQNPMIGFRGASRYYSNSYKDGFKLECNAIRKVRDEMGFHNLKIMIPFCRTVEEGKKVIALMGENGLKQGENHLEVYTMAEIPSNVILAEEFAEIFDGFSIGSNDLTQLVLGVDRDSELMSDLFNENDPAVRKFIAEIIKSAKKTGRKIGLCGQAPSDSPEFASFLVKTGIDSISFNPDALLNGIQNIYRAENEITE